ncbi:MAG: rRNA maturation RNase YbeY [Granulosicoccus sp.]
MFELNLMLAEARSLDSSPLGEAQLKGQCSTTLECQSRLAIGGIDQIEVSVQMLDAPAMQSLNNTYRNKDSATNVLSFESGLPVLNDNESLQLLVLGDLVFCPDIIAREARQQGKSEAQHWAHMVVHGTLHLCGYDHLEPADATEMENLEIQILSGMGIPNPYQIQSVQ